MAQLFAGDQLEILASLLRIELLVFEQRIDQQAHGSERGFEFVGDSADEVGLHAREAKLLAKEASCEKTGDGHGYDHEIARPKIGRCATASGFVHDLRIDDL